MAIAWNSFGQVSAGLSIGAVRSWIKAPLKDSSDYLNTKGNLLFAAPSVYFYLSENASFSFETQLALGEYFNEPWRIFQLGRDDALGAKTLMMLRLNLFSAANTWEEEGLTLGLCNGFLGSSYDCFNLGLTIGIGREWTSPLIFEDVQTTSFVSYPLEFGLTFNAFHPSTAIGLTYRYNVDRRETSSQALGLIFTYSFFSY